MKGLAISVAAVLIAGSQPLFAQPTGFCTCFADSGSEILTTIDVSFNVSRGSGGSLESASGSGAGAVSIVDLASEVDLACIISPWFPAKLTTYADADSSPDLSSQAVSFRAEELRWWEHMTPHGPWAAGSVSSSGGSLETWADLDAFGGTAWEGPCGPKGQFQILVLDNSVASVSGDWSFDGGVPSIEIKVDFNITSNPVGSQLGSECCEAVGTSLGASSTSATFTRAVVTAYYDDQTSSEFIADGLLVGEVDEHRQYGAYDHPSLIYTWTDPGFWLEGYDLPLFSLSGANIVRITLTLATETWDAAFRIGDIDEDEEVCASDRAVIMGAINSSVGDSAYEPRADLDLDGDVDADDLAIFNTLPCNADLNCDGVVDFSDYLEFQNLYAAEDPMADFDGSGTFDFFDSLAFNDAYGVGC